MKRGEVELFHCGHRKATEDVGFLLSISDIITLTKQAEYVSAEKKPEKNVSTSSEQSSLKRAIVDLAIGRCSD